MKWVIQYDIILKLNGFANENDVRKEIDMLVNDGTFYNTLNDEHVAYNDI